MKDIYDWCNFCRDNSEKDAIWCVACIRQTLHKNMILVPKPVTFND